VHFSNFTGLHVFEKPLAGFSCFTSNNILTQKNIVTFNKIRYQP